MTRNSRKKNRETALVEKLLQERFPNFPQQFPPEAYRYNPASIRVRIVNEIFHGLDRIQREELVIPVLKRNLPEETWWDVTMILMLTPDEVEESRANREFEHPTPSRI